MKSIKKILIDSKSNFVCNFNRSVQDIIKRFNEIDQKFILLISDEKKFVGTVTDGDLRRAMLHENFFSTNHHFDTVIANILSSTLIKLSPVFEKVTNVITEEYFGISFHAVSVYIQGETAWKFWTCSTFRLCGVLGPAIWPVPV